jgi:diphosphomevalonate decarboxylase
LFAAARAHTNIALIKYWGKKDERLILPMNSSLSLTLDAFYTETSVLARDDLAEDSIVMDGKTPEAGTAGKIRRFMDLVREKSGHRVYAEIQTTNHVPVASGLASSASGFAALAAAASGAYGLDLTQQALSRLARRGSGSASRSIAGGFVEWQKGYDDASSYAVPIDRADWGVRMIVVGVDRNRKKISSREGMKRTVATSPFYPVWISEAEKDLAAMKQAVRQHNLKDIGRIAEANALKMHALMLAADPPFCYWEAGTMTAMHCVHELRAQGTVCYFTIDAGPNVKIICDDADVARVLDKLSGNFRDDALTVAGPGPGVQFLEHL